MMKIFLIGLFAIVAFLQDVRAASLPDVKLLLKRVEDRLEKVNADTNRFHYVRTNLLEELDSNAKVKKSTAKTYVVLLRQGLPRARLVAIDGRALPESEQRKHRFHEERLQRTLAQDKNPNYEKPKPWLDDELMERFQFNVIGRTNRDGRSLVMLTFAPKPNAPAENMIDRVINKISGALWVDEEEAEIAVLDLHMNDSIKFWGGILGQLDRFDFTMQRRRSDLGVWFNSGTSGVVYLRKLFNTSRFRFTEQAFDFKAGDVAQ